MTPDQTTCEITWCEHWAGYGPRDARCRCHGPLVDELGPGSPDCPDAADCTHADEHPLMLSCPCGYLSRSARELIAQELRSLDKPTGPTWLGTVLESCIRDVALGRIASHSSVTDEMVTEWRRLNPGRDA